MTRFKGRVIQDGIEVATVHANNEKRMLQVLLHYAFIYSHDGPVRIQTIIKRKWRDIQITVG